MKKTFLSLSLLLTVGSVMARSNNDELLVTKVEAHEDIVTRVEKSAAAPEETPALETPAEAVPAATKINRLRACLEKEFPNGHPELENFFSQIKLVEDLSQIGKDAT